MKKVTAALRREELLRDNGKLRRLVRELLLACLCGLVVCGALLVVPKAARARRRLKCDVYVAKSLGWVKRATRRHLRDCLRHRFNCPDDLAEARIRKIIGRAVKRINKRCPRPDAMLQARRAELDVVCGEYDLCAEFGRMSMQVVASAPGSQAKLLAQAGTATGAGEAAGEIGQLASVRVDVGSSGIAHGLQILQGAGFSARLLNCDGESDTVCDIVAEVAGEPFGAPSPLSPGGVPFCVTLHFTSDLTGTINLDSGELAEAATLEAGLYNGMYLRRPCPACITGSPEPALGDAGLCSGGLRDGEPCVVEGLSDIGYGLERATSNDCPPRPATNIARFKIRVRPATTAEVSLAPGISCTAPGWGDVSCWCDTCAGGSDPGAPCASNADCPGGGICGARRCVGGVHDGQLCKDSEDCPGGSCTRPGSPTMPNACLGGVTDCVPVEGGTAGICASGPIDTVCNEPPFWGCESDDDCLNSQCVARTRSCFPDPIRRIGRPDPVVSGIAHPVLVGTMCLSPSASSAVNAAAGFPGPLAFTWPTLLTVTPAP